MFRGCASLKGVRSLLVVLLITVGGCDGGEQAADAAAAVDMSTAPDLVGVPTPDLPEHDGAQPPDLVQAPDLAAPSDQAMPDAAAPDLAQQPDLVVVPDLAPSPDLVPEACVQCIGQGNCPGAEDCAYLALTPNGWCPVNVPCQKAQDCGANNNFCINAVGQGWLGCGSNGMCCVVDACRRDTDCCPNSDNVAKCVVGGQGNTCCRANQNPCDGNHPCCPGLTCTTGHCKP